MRRVNCVRLVRHAAILARAGDSASLPTDVGVMSFNWSSPSLNRDILRITIPLFPFHSLHIKLYTISSHRQLTPSSVLYIPLP